MAGVGERLKSLFGLRKEEEDKPNVVVSREKDIGGAQIGRYRVRPVGLPGSGVWHYTPDRGDPKESSE